MVKKVFILIDLPTVPCWVLMDYLAKDLLGIFHQYLNDPNVYQLYVYSHLKGGGLINNVLC